MNKKVIAYMNKAGIPVLDQNVVWVNIDDGCEMAEVLVNGELIMMGSFWDFHPGCHGIDLPFASYDSLAQLFVEALDPVELQVNEDWVYED